MQPLARLVLPLVVMMTTLLLVMLVSVTSATAATDDPCQNKESNRIHTQLLHNLTKKVCEGEEKDCLAKIPDCRILFSSGDPPEGSNMTEMVSWFGEQLEKLRITMEGCKEENPIFESITFDKFPDALSTYNGMVMSCLNLAAIKDDLHMSEEQLIPMLECVLHQYGMLSQLITCVNHGINTHGVEKPKLGMQYKKTIY